MKKCPFCAEDIQDEAIKCRYCGSSLTAPVPGAAAPGPAVGLTGPAGGPPFAHAPDERRERKVLYYGSPSWRAYLGYYIVGVLGTLVLPVLGHLTARWLKATQTTHVLLVAIPLACALVYFTALHFTRKSTKIRVSSTNIESEYGLLSRKIDVLELWRCRDVRYQQSLVDRILGIAHIQVYTADVTTPHLEMVGLPASRQLFEQIRDNIEIQRQSRNVYGVIS